MELNAFEFVIPFLVGHRLVVVVFFCGGAYPVRWSSCVFFFLFSFLTFVILLSHLSLQREGSIYFLLLQEEL